MTSASAPSASSSQSLREKGNLAFRSSRWADAADLYTQALEAASAASSKPGEEEHEEKRREHLAALYSNRAAARIQLCEFDLALLDATAAQQLQPEWSRARAREAEAFSRLHSFEEARASYAAAVALAEDAATRERYMAASAACLAELEAQQRKSMLEEAEEKLGFVERYEAYLRKRGEGEKEEELVSARTAVQAWRVCEKAWAEMDEGLVVKENGEVLARTPSPILDLADGIILDSRGFHLPAGSSASHPLSEKLKLQLAWDAKVFELERFTRAQVVPKEVIDHYEKRVEEEGWARVKPALAHLIRGCFTAAYINEVQLRSAEAAAQYRFVLGLLSEGRVRWEGVDEEDKGATFRFTFERKVKMHLVETLIDAHFRSPTPSTTSSAAETEAAELLLQEAQSLAEELMDDCAREKVPGDDEVATFSFQVQPIVSSGLFFAYFLRVRASLRENRLDSPAGYWVRPGEMKAGGKMYAKAAELLPPDDPEKAQCLFNALAFDLRAGGLTLRELFARAAEAERAMEVPEKIFGSATRLFSSRLLVRQICSSVRALLAPDLPSLPPQALNLEKTLRAIPTVFKGKIPHELAGRWEEMVEEEVWEKYVTGEVRVAELVEEEQEQEQEREEREP
ncbi:hypothetical protein JCM10213_004273 [Rhodosporidiobolus nylandii]